jgi:hypothetical protein
MDYSHLYIEDNYFDGYEAQTIMLAQTGAATVRRNLFGATTASQSNMQDEETMGVSLGAAHPAMFVNANINSNRRILGWYPTAVSTVGCELRVTVDQPTAAPEGFNLPIGPVTLDFYYTKGRTAEKYIGSVENVSEPGTIILPNMPEEAGFIRIQTQGQPPIVENDQDLPGRQPESSHYSRAVAFAGPSSDISQCRNDQVLVDMQAWTDVDGQGASYDAILSSGSELGDGAYVLPGSSIWYTYTVKNPHWVPLHTVLVEDETSGAICMIDDLPPLATAGCSIEKTVPLRTGGPPRG